MKQGQGVRTKLSICPFLGWRWSSVKGGVKKDSADVAPGAGLVGRHSAHLRAWNRFQLSVCRTSHRIWVAFLALKSSGVSSSTVSPLPFTPSSRSLLYSLYRWEEQQRDCREGHTGRPGQGIQNTQYSRRAWGPALSAQSHHDSQQTDSHY